MILGLLHKTSGRLTVFGKPPTDVAVKRYIGFLPEESYLYRFLNARETLDYYGKLFGLDRRTRRRRTDELLDMVGLTQVAHRPIGEFSKGMTRRIGLAQALINDPEFLILDEPTSGLDPIGTRQVKDLLLELRPPRQDDPAQLAPARRRRGRVRPHGHAVRRQDPRARARPTSCSATRSAR